MSKTGQRPPATPPRSVAVSRPQPASPTRRVAPTRAVRPRRMPALAVALAAAALAALVLGGLLVAQRAGQVGTPVADEGRGHVADGVAIPYRHDPPASGPHYGTPASAGFYTAPVPAGNFVHSLEHGYIVILYQCPSDCAALQQQLRDLSAAFPPSKFGNVKLVVAPYPHLPATLTALAWDWELPLDGVDRQQLLRFYRAHVDHGPEDVP